MSCLRPPTRSLTDNCTPSCYLSRSLLSSLLYNPLFIPSLLISLNNNINNHDNHNNLNHNNLNNNNNNNNKDEKIIIKVRGGTLDRAIKAADGEEGLRERGVAVEVDGGAGGVLELDYCHLVIFQILVYCKRVLAHRRLVFCVPLHHIPPLPLLC